MVSELIIQDLNIEKAQNSDWNSILILLTETNLTFWLCGNENYKNFYIIKDKNSESLACCFAIDTEKSTGILKSFAVRKDLQGKGIGKLVVSKLPDMMNKLNINKLYASSCEASGFWKKTLFSEININDVKDNFYLKYTNNLKTNHPDLYPQTVHFLLEN